MTSIELDSVLLLLHPPGLCGGNGVGKSTLMKAIAKGQLDGFPPASELRTVYVEHDIQVRFGLGLLVKHSILCAQHSILCISCVAS